MKLVLLEWLLIKKFELYCCHTVEQASWKGQVKRREEQTQVHSIKKSHQSWSRSFISMIIYITRCTAFKCGLLFHCTKAVQVHFEKQHIKGRLVEVWDDLWYLNQTWPLGFSLYYAPYQTLRLKPVNLTCDILYKISFKSQNNCELSVTFFVSREKV